MKILHSFLSIGSGFLVIAILVAITTILLKRIAPEMAKEQSPPRRLPLIMNLVTSALFAATGGYVTAWVAR